MEKVLTVEMQIAERARKFRDEPLTNLQKFIDEEMLLKSFFSLNKKGASGVDKETWASYNERRPERIPALLKAFKTGSYRAPLILRKYIPKDDGSKRPLGMPTVEDKILQTAVSKVLAPVYEEVFCETSYGFRPGKSQHQALDKLFKETSFAGKRYVIDADMQNYFGSIVHKHLRDFIAQRINDGVIKRMIGKWLKAGIMENGQVAYPEEGTPQGGNISPLLSNVYLHYVLDEWFTSQIQPLLKGRSTLIRFADDFLLLFDNKEDARRVMEVLPKRLGKYGLTLHPEKTKLIELTPGQGGKPETFDFLGFTHYMGKSRKGIKVLKRKTSRKKLRSALKRMTVWMKLNRHKPVKEIITKLNPKLRGHYNYYGITFNSRMINVYFYQVTRLLHKWLNRRGGKRVWNWEKVTKLVTQWQPLEKPSIKHSYR